MINIINHTLNMDLANKINMNSPINIKKNDTNSHKFIINLFNSSASHDLTGTTSRIYFKKSDGTKVFLSCVLDGSINNKLSVLLTTQTLTTIGSVACEITIYGTSGEIQTSFTFNFNVLENIRDDETIESTNDFTALTDALAVVTTIANKADKTYVDANLDIVNSQLAENAKQINSMVYNVKFPFPTNLPKLVGGGIDDSVAFQAVLDYIPDGTVIFFPPDILGYNIASGVILTKNQICLTSSIRSEYTTKIFCHTPNTTLLKVTGYGYIQNNLIMEGDGVLTYDVNGLITDMIPPTVTTLSLDRGSDPNIDAEITNCIFSYAKDSIYCKGRNLKVKGNLFSQCVRGVTLDVVVGQQTRGIRIFENRFHTLGYNGSVDSDFVDSWCIKCLSTDVLYMFGNEIRDNYADFCKGFYYGPLHLNSIKGNKIFQSYGNGIYIEQSQGAGHGWSLSGNDIDMWRSSALSDVPTLVSFGNYGIYGNNIDGGEIYGNTVTGSRKEGIKLVNPSNMDLSHNFVMNANFRADLDGHIYDGISASVCANVNISDNTVRCTLTHATVDYRYGINVSGTGKIKNNNVINAFTGLYKNLGLDQIQFNSSNLGIYKNTLTSVGIDLQMINASGQLPFTYSSIHSLMQSSGVGGEKANLSLRTMASGTMTEVASCLWNHGFKVAGSAWNGIHLVLGDYHIWVDTNDKLRIKNGVPITDLDGTITGNQT